MVLPVHLYITTSITLLVSLICFIISFFLVTVHLRQTILTEGFFKVVFIVILIELCMNLMIIINTILNLFNTLKDDDDNDNDWKNMIVGFLNDFFFSSHISYNLIMTIFLIRKSRSKEPLIQQEISNQTSRQQSIQLNRQSFKYIHILGVFVGLLHSGICIGVQYSNIYSLPLVSIAKSTRSPFAFFLFILNYCYFILSLIYTAVSCDRFHISELIRLRNYSLFCLTTSVLWMIFPLIYLINYLPINNNTVDSLMIYFETIFFSALLITNSCFHLNSYYIAYILESKGTTFCDKVSMGFKLLFYIQAVPELNFIDYHSSFIYHSLLSKKDLLNESVAVAVTVEHSVLEPLKENKEGGGTES